MKHSLIMLMVLIAHSSTFYAQSSTPQTANQSVKASLKADVVHVNTAFDHLTVLEFGEPVAMAAAGSNAFQIERQSNKVFVKPLRQGASTDLFVWTQSRRFTYELEAPGEVKDMNFVIDNPVPVSRPLPDTHDQMVRIAEMMLTKALLDSEHIDSGYMKDIPGSLTLRVEQIVESSNALYIHYSIANRTTSAWHVPPPITCQVLPVKSTISVRSLVRKQLSESLARKLGEIRRVPLQPASSEVQNQNLAPGEETRGVIAIRQQFSQPTILELSFPGEHNVAAIFVR